MLDCLTRCETCGRLSDGYVVIHDGEWFAHFDGSPIVYWSEAEAESIAAGLRLLFPKSKATVEGSCTCSGVEGK